MISFRHIFSAGMLLAMTIPNMNAMQSGKRGTLTIQLPPGNYIVTCKSSSPTHAETLNPAQALSSAKQDIQVLISKQLAPADDEPLDAFFEQLDPTVFEQLDPAQALEFAKRLLKNISRFLNNTRIVLPNKIKKIVETAFSGVCLKAPFNEKNKEAAVKKVALRVFAELIKSDSLTDDDRDVISDKLFLDDAAVFCIKSLISLLIEEKMLNDDLSSVLDILTVVLDSFKRMENKSGQKAKKIKAFAVIEKLLRFLIVSHMNRSCVDKCCKSNDSIKYVIANRKPELEMDGIIDTILNLILKESQHQDKETRYGAQKVLALLIQRHLKEYCFKNHMTIHWNIKQALGGLEQSVWSGKDYDLAHRVVMALNGDAEFVVEISGLSKALDAAKYLPCQKNFMKNFILRQYSAVQAAGDQIKEVLFFDDVD